MFEEKLLISRSTNWKGGKADLLSHQSLIKIIRPRNSIAAFSNNTEEVKN